MTKLFSIRLLPSIFAALVLGFLAYSLNSCNQGPPDNSRAVQAQKGKAHFVKHCASCHGEDGKGIIIDTMAIQPADLTRIKASRKVNEFPIQRIAKIIDGRQVVAAHGGRSMPVWGDVFKQEENLSDTELRGKLGEIIAFLMSIQEG